MKTAVIILNYNSENDTIRYVNEIKNYNCIDTIIVVDNNSTNINSFEKIKNLENEKIHVIKSDKNGGYSYGNNYGLRYLENLAEKYDYIVISNPDVEVKENVFESCFKELEENNNIAVVAPKMIDKNGNHIRRSSWKIRTPKIDMINSTRLNEILFYKLFKSGEYTEDDFKQAKLNVEAVSGAFFTIKFEVFKKIRFF
ncbi:MAG: glycosyltransferase family 2 protein [Clostridia bacterium]|nr:glycosyltransferase family 2 protein [Clostridia bacterium]